MRSIFSFIFLIISTFSAAQEEIDVGLFRASSIKKIDLVLRSATSYFQVDQGPVFYGTTRESKLLVVSENNRIHIYVDGFSLGEGKTIKVVAADSALFLKPSAPDLKGNYYQGNILISSQQGKFNIINRVEMPDYLCGVLRGEIGFEKPNSVYEMHAIMSRTYAKRFEDRHRAEGFQICDQTHCQVYKGWFDYAPFYEAIYASEGIIVLDASTKTPAECLFHSNCGGQTCASEDVWSARLPYCRSVTDTFCTSGKHAIWEKRIAYTEFLKKLGLSAETFTDPELQLCYYSSGRNNRVSLGDRNFDAITMRSALGLKSAWFSIELDLDTVVFSGKGFGHGVGVCQEGAIGMAAYGCSAEEILNHYYRSTLFFNTRKNEVISVLFE